MEFKFSNEFGDALEEIQNYIQENFQSEQSGKNIASKIFSKIQILKNIPELGIDFDDRVGRNMIPGYVTRMLIIDKKYLVFYVADNSAISILHLVHAKPDYLNQLEYLFSKNSFGI